MKKILRSATLFAVVSIMLTACWPAQTYDKNGISFNYPGGWVITDDEYGNSQGYLSLTKEGTSPKATVTFGWLESTAEIGADMMLNNIFRDMQATEPLADLVSQPAEDTKYGAYPARAVTYTATVNGIPVSGAVWVFRAEDRVVNVAVREGAGNENVPAFKKIKDSFKLSAL